MGAVPNPTVSTVVPEPAMGEQRPWPASVVIGLGVAGLISPLIPFAGAVAAFALADKQQGTMLTAVALAHVVLGLTILGSA